MAEITIHPRKLPAPSHPGSALHGPREEKVPRLGQRKSNTAFVFLVDFVFVNESKTSSNALRRSPITGNRYYVKHTLHEDLPVGLRSCRIYEQGGPQPICSTAMAFSHKSHSKALKKAGNWSLETRLDAEGHSNASSPNQFSYK
jgi:hypothetical protein